jgi:hypothetical protein
MHFSYCNFCLDYCSSKFFANSTPTHSAESNDMFFHIIKHDLKKFSGYPFEGIPHGRKTSNWQTKNWRPGESDKESYVEVSLKNFKICVLKLQLHDF